MPNDFDQPLRIYDLTNKKPIKIKTEVEYFDANIANIADAIEDKPSEARMFGTSGIAGVIGASGTTLKAKSSSSSEATNIIVRIEGYIDSSKTILDYENITIPTSAPDTYVSGTKTFYEVVHISKDIDTTGYIIIANSSSTVLSNLSPTDRVMQHKIMKLGKIPDAVYSMRSLYKRKIRKMINDNDYPFFDADDYFIFDSVGWAYAQEKESLDRANIAWQQAQKALLNTIGNIDRGLGPDYQHKFVSMWAQAHKL